MKKPDIFDEIIACLSESRFLSPDTSMSTEILQAFYKPAETHTVKKVAPTASVPQEQPQKQPQGIRRREEIRVPAMQDTPAPAMQDIPVRAVQNVPAPAEPEPQLRQGYAQDPRINADMDTLRRLAMDCRTCKLCPTRTHVVFEDGNRNARLMFIGEGPGADEDAAGVPFVGRAGQLLTKMIHAMTFDRQRDVYIANIVKCRPPSNRNPEEDEAFACLPFLRRQIELVHPEVIVLLGAVPLRYLLGMEGISKLRGQWLDYKGIKVMATYHPAFLLRNPRAKIDVWADLQKVMAVFGRQPPRRG